MRRFKKEQTQLSCILDLLGVHLRLTLKYHPEISGIGIEYTWGYAKLRSRREFNDTIPRNLRINVLRSLNRSVITRDRVFKFTRKARKYKISYLTLVHEADGADATAAKDNIAHITKLFKVHRSAMDADYLFIVEV